MAEAKPLCFDLQGNSSKSTLNFCTQTCQSVDYGKSLGYNKLEVKKMSFLFLQKGVFECEKTDGVIHILKYLPGCRDNRHSSHPSAFTFELSCQENFVNDGIRYPNLENTDV